eukprot:snap_masked-scaffold_61-processed-gene-0.33-mRNA-1 protein AED:1.00 eAED:1.00 QI:0/-1/0/0/-1/1/1/0/67
MVMQKVAKDEANLEFREKATPVLLDSAFFFVNCINLKQIENFGLCLEEGYCLFCKVTDGIGGYCWKG